MATAMTLEQGKPIGQSRLEILRGCDVINGTRPGAAYMAASSEPGVRHTVLPAIGLWLHSHRGIFP
jgi:succinate-semialdehyde dehydrogenase/glutarate-semialdehyde dehydrogenase